MALLLSVFAISIAIATIIESKYDTSTARAMVYNSLWFELVLLFAFINLCGIIFSTRMHDKKKLPVFIFHLALLLILVGAATTRFFGKDGYMHIREGESSNKIITNDVFFCATARHNGQEAYTDKLVYFSTPGNNCHKLKLTPAGQKVLIEFLEYIPNNMHSGSMSKTESVIPGEISDSVLLRIIAGGETKTIWYHAQPEGLNKPQLIKVAKTEIVVSIGAKIIELPFSLQLKKFILEHYPGTESPSWFESKVLLIDKLNSIKEDHRIYMNNILTYNGYRFFQSSYDSDEHGTILSVNYDYWGTLISYAGYFLLLIGILLSFINPGSRLRVLYREIGSNKAAKVISIALLITIMCFGSTINIKADNKLSDSTAIDRTQAANFGELLVQDHGGRIKPVNSLSSELIRKVTYSNSFTGLSNDQVLLGMMAFPEYWQRIPMIRVSDFEIKKILHISDNYVSFLDVLNITQNTQEYLLEPYVNIAYQKQPARRTKFDNDIIKVDERINLCYQIYTGELLHIFPKKNDPQKKWYTPVNAASSFQGSDSVFTTIILPMYLRSVKDAVKSKNWVKSDEVLVILKDYQKKYGYDIIPSETKIKLEIIYNRLDIFQRLSAFYGLAGFILLIFGFMTVFLQKLKLKLIVKVSVILLILCFIVQGAGLIVRWYISGHAPWSNAYESMVYISFATVFAGILFSKKSVIILAAAAILASLILFVAHLNWMDPEITNLVPVLKSYWLLIHVAVITASYGFLGLGALLALINLVIMIFRNKTNGVKTSEIINKLTLIIEIILIIGLYMLTIGTFLGGVWANESWGHYWSWDPKETWALVSILVYAIIAHMRLIPGLKGIFTFNMSALLGFSSVIMTYFGVNYYLTGLHSYAKGDPAPIPSSVYYTLIIVASICFMAWWKQNKFENLKK